MGCIRCDATTIDNRCTRSDVEEWDCPLTPPPPAPPTTLRENVALMVVGALIMATTVGLMVAFVRSVDWLIRSYLSGDHAVRLGVDIAVYTFLAFATVAVSWVVGKSARQLWDDLRTKRDEGSGGDPDQ